MDTIKQAFGIDVANEYTQYCKKITLVSSSCKLELAEELKLQPFMGTLDCWLMTPRIDRMATFVIQP
jgi:hypothetical protein